MRKLQKAGVVAGVILCGLLSCFALPSVAQAQVPHQVKILVGFPPGGGSDVVARILADKLKSEWGASVVVENKSGAGGQLAAQALKSAPADGSTLFLSHDHTISILPLVTKNLGYEPSRDFVPVAGFATFVNAFAVSARAPVRSFTDYVALVKQQGGRANVGVPAAASTPEFLVDLIAKKYRLDLQSVPYRGSAPLIADLLGEQIQAGVASVPDLIENHKAQKLRIVAVMGRNRISQLPNVPTFREIGLANVEEVPYYGIFAPVGTPKEVLDSLAAGLEKVLAMPEVRESLSKMGLTVHFMTSEELARRERAYASVWRKLITSSGFQIKQ